MSRSVPPGGFWPSRDRCPGDRPVLRGWTLVFAAIVVFQLELNTKLKRRRCSEGGRHVPVG